MFAGKDFLSMQPPPGYKAGIGRGATGFTTRADVPLQRGDPSRATSNNRDRFLDADEKGLLNNKEALARDDREAERIYTSLNEKLSRRYAKSRKSTDQEPDKESGPESEFLGDYKKELASVSIDEWANLPEATDLTRRNKRLRLEEDMERRSYAVPDSVFQGSRGFDNAIDISSEAMEAKDNVLSARLDMAFKTRSEPEKKDVPESSAAFDAERRRGLLETMIKTQPNQPQGYIGLARLHSDLQQFKKARAAIHKGMDLCPTVPEIWLEAMKIHHGADAMAIATKAIKAVPQSAEVWRAVIDLQSTKQDKLQYVHLALEQLSENSELWELAIDLENDQDKKEVLDVALELAPSPALYLRAASYDPSLLDQAVKQFPDNKSLWLAKIRKGESVVTAIEATGPAGWIEIAQTCEQENDIDTMTSIIACLDLTEKEFDSLYESGNYTAAKFVARKITKTVSLYRKWSTFEPEILVEAVRAFSDETLMLTFIKHDPEAALREFETDFVFINAGREFLVESDLSRAESVLSRSTSAEGKSLYVHTLVQLDQTEKAKEVVTIALDSFPDYEKLYLQKFALFKDLSVLETASKRFPKSPEIWIALAEALPDVRARAILISAQAHCPKNARLWLTRIRLERKAGRDPNYLLTKALQECPKSGPLWAEQLLLTPKLHRSRKIAEAVKATENHPAVLVAAGLHQWALSKPATKWFETAIKQNEQWGDAYLWLYLYGLDTQGATQDIIDNLAKVKPTEGEIWAPIYASNLGKPIGDIFTIATKSVMNNPFV